MSGDTVTVVARQSEWPAELTTVGHRDARVFATMPNLSSWYDYGRQLARGAFGKIAPGPVDVAVELRHHGKLVPHVYAIAPTVHAVLAGMASAAVFANADGARVEVLDDATFASLTLRRRDDRGLPCLWFHFTPAAGLGRYLTAHEAELEAAFAARARTRGAFSG